MKTAIILLISMLSVACSTHKTDNRNSSENFKDGAFHNSTNVKTSSFWDIVWGGLTSDIEQAEWPEWITTEEDKNPLERVQGDNTRITFINHASFLIQGANLNILTDPVFSERTSPVSFAGPKRIHKPGIELENLPKIDVIIISHDHYDHLDLSSINQLIERDNPKVYMGLGVASRLERSENNIEMDWGDMAQIGDNFKIWFLEVQHFSGRTLLDRDSTLWGGFYMQLAGKKIYFGGDSGYADHYKKAFQQFGAMDISLIPIGAYAPRQFFKPVHLDPFEAVQAHQDLHSGVSIGMHYGTFQLSAESRTDPVTLLDQAKIEAGVASSDFITMEIGQPVTFSAKNTQ